MKKVFHGAVLSLVMLLAISNGAVAGPLCALAPASHNPMVDQPSTPFANSMMQSINNVLCEKFQCPAYVLIQNQTTSNAMASSDPSGSRIRYNPNFMNITAQTFGQFAAAGIFAHELGHIIDFATNPNPGIPQPRREANADEYAGCAFALAGRRQADLAGLARSLHSMGASPGYPTPDQRVQLVLNGYQKCSQ